MNKEENKNGNVCSIIELDKFILKQAKSNF